MIPYEKQKEQRMKKGEQSLWDIQNIIKENNTHVGKPRRRKEKEKGAEKLSEEIMAENLPSFFFLIPKFVEDIHINIQERSLAISKQNEFKESHTQTHYNQTVQRQRQS